MKQINQRNDDIVTVSQAMQAFAKIGAQLSQGVEIGDMMEWPSQILFNDGQHANVFWDRVEMFKKFEDEGYAMDFVPKMLFAGAFQNFHEVETRLRDDEEILAIHVFVANFDVRHCVMYQLFGVRDAFTEINRSTVLDEYSTTIGMLLHWIVVEKKLSLEQYLQLERPVEVSMYNQTMLTISLFEEGKIDHQEACKRFATLQFEINEFGVAEI